MKTSTLKKIAGLLCTSLLFGLFSVSAVSHGSIKGVAVPFYAQGPAGGNVASPIATSTLDYKVVTKGSKSWAYLHFNGTSGIDIGAGWTSQLRYWTSTNGKTENNLTDFRDAASKIITVSNMTRDIVINKYNISPDKVETVYNAVEPVPTCESSDNAKGFDEKVVTFLGRITLQKGPEYFIEAAYKVLQVMDNVRFVMAGSGDMMERMIRRAASLKITDRFHFTGFLKGADVYTMLNMSDVYIMPSVSEPFGISPLEAMQSNVPVIISKQSGVAEILTHAVKTDFWDIDAMADAIYGILNYPALSNMFITNGKEEVIRLKWDNSARHVRDIYYGVIEANKK